MTQTAVDPWAQAAGQTATTNSAPAATTTNGGYASSAVAAQNKNVGSISNPFGNAREYAGQGGGLWDPRVPFAYLENRAIVMIPRALDANAKDPFNEGQTREEWRVDIVILDGEPFEFTYNAKESKDAQPVEKTMQVSAFPAVFKQQSVAQGQLVKALKGVDADPEKLFLFGVLRRVPQFRDAATETVDSIAEKMTRYRQDVAAGKPGAKEPRHTWNLIADSLTEAQSAAAMAWWTQAKSTWPNV